MSHHPFPWREPFLAALRQWPVVKQACEAVDIDRSTAYRAREADKDFAEAWDRAMDDGVDRAEQEAFRRAVEGEAEPVIYQGQPTYVLEHDEAGYPIYDTVQEERPGFDAEGKPTTQLVDVKRPRRKLDANGQPIILTVRKRSDALLTKILSARRKEYGTQRTELTGADGGPVQQQQVVIATGVPSVDDDPIA